MLGFSDHDRGQNVASLRYPYHIHSSPAGRLGFYKILEHEFSEQIATARVSPFGFLNGACCLHGFRFGEKNSVAFAFSNFETSASEKFVSATGAFSSVEIVMPKLLTSSISGCYRNHIFRRVVPLLMKQAVIC